VIKKFFMAWILPALFAPSALPADDTLSQKINSLADRYYDFRLRTRPEIAYFSGVEIERHDGLYDNSPEALGREQAMEDELLLALGKIDPASIRGGVTLECQPDERLAVELRPPGRTPAGGNHGPEAAGPEALGKTAVLDRPGNRKPGNGIEIRLFGAESGCSKGHRAIGRRAGDTGRGLSFRFSGEAR
jgi:hypothetical protein